jgi:DNA-binding LytR/AlgR family response regulator
MSTALIADDEPNLVRHLQTLLAQAWPELTLLPPARNGLEAAERIAAQSPDIAFLDIQMPGLTGLQVAQGIEGETRVVFVTAYDEYALQAFEAAAVDYLLKPLKLERLQRTVERLKSGAADDRLPQAMRQLAPPRPAQPLRFVRA